MTDSEPRINLNGRIMASSQALLPAVQSGIHYGTGCFETFVMEQGRVFRYDNHMERLLSGLTYLGVPEELRPEPDHLFREIKALAEANGLMKENARIRLQFVLDERRGYGPDEDARVHRVITCTRVKRAKKPVALITARTRTVPAECRPAAFKLSNMLHYRNAFREALSQKADDALLLTVDGHVAETSIANIFWKKKHTIFTPSVGCDILPGIMRNSLIGVLRDMDEWTLSEGKFSPETLFSADIVWITNSVTEICAVRSVDGIVFSTEDLILDRLNYKLKMLKKTQSRS